MSGYWGQNTQSPSKEYLLREEYPDLNEKWIMYQDYEHDFLNALTRLEKFGKIKIFFNPKKYDRAYANWSKTKNSYENAEKEYLLLEKLLWDY